jgi:hypothetical protein
MSIQLKQAAVAALMIALISTAQARSVRPVEDARAVDLVIALDVSGSMSGLIDSARQRLWDVVNELGQAQTPVSLRIAIVSFGNPGYGAENGYVRINQGFTSDLDAVNETLFAFTTNGGEEYVARAIHQSLTGLDWRNSANGLRVVFVAGNESARQDPQFPIAAVINDAKTRDVVINALYCGGDNDEVAAEWRDIPQMVGGFYASIDQDAAALANLATPMDDELLRLNQALNATYLAYGAKGKRARENQVRQDRNAESMSAPAAASRVVAKAGSLYETSDWDLVGALESGIRLEDIEEEALPESLRDLESEQRQATIDKLTDQRGRLKQEIASLDRDRRAWIKQQQAADAEKPLGLDRALVEGLRRIAEDRGFQFAGGPKG